MYREQGRDASETGKLENNGAKVKDGNGDEDVVIMMSLVKILKVSRDTVCENSRCQCEY